MNRNSRLPVRSTQLLDTGSKREQEPRSSRNETRRTTRASSTSRITGSRANSLCTPSFRRSNSQVSLKRSPQSAQVNRNRSGERSKMKRKDNRPIQDKKWQADMLHKTQHYFQSDPEGAMILNQGRNLRPITIRMFTQLVNVVLKNIDEEFEELTTTNYVDLLPKHMSRLMYPGSITSSILKTANTMHSWPHILAILSWLVGLHITMQNMKAFVDENMYLLPNDLTDQQYQELKILQLQDQFLTSSFVLWNDGQEDSDDPEMFASTLRQIYGIEEHTMRQWYEMVEKFSKQLECDKNNIEKQRLEIANKENEHTKLMDKINYLEEHKKKQIEYIKKLEKKKEQYQKDNQKLRKLNEKTVDHINVLQDKIKIQPMTKQEKETEMIRIKDLKVKQDLMAKERKHQQEISDETDIRISQLKRKIEEQVSAFNMELLKPSLKHPELKQFKIKAGSVLGAEFSEEVRSKMKILEEFTTELQSKLKEERRAFVLAEEEYQKVKKELEKGLADKKEVQIQIDDWIRKIETAKAVYAEEEENKLKIIESLKQQISDMKSEFPDIETLKEKCKQQVVEYEKLKKKYETDACNMLLFFKKLKTEIVHNIIPQYQEIRKQITADVVKLVNPSSEDKN